MSRLDGRERWVFLGLAYALLAISATAAALTGTSEGDPGAPSWAPSWSLPWSLPWSPSWPSWWPSWWPASWSSSGPSAGAVWPVLAVAAAGWVAPLAWLHPRRDRRPVLVVGHYLVLVALAGTLTAAHAAFAVFAAIGYPLALALLPSRLVMAGVTVTAVVVVAAQAAPGDRAALLTVIAGVALPLAVAGWYVAAEHDKRRRLVGRLRAAMDENASLHARLLDQARHAGVRDERHRVAGELHDTLTQDLVALIRQLDAAAVTTGEESGRHLGQAAALARQGLAEARRSVSALLPGPLERSSLPEALERMAASWSRMSGVPLAREVTGSPVALSADLEATLFRVAQEALANVAKHAEATRAALTLSYTDDLVLLDIRDDGAGFDPQAATDGFGLDGMRQRVRAAGGTLEIESQPGAGTAIAAAVPALTVARPVPPPSTAVHPSPADETMAGGGEDS
ncbi:sensor histidine kinase [Nonomuraea wenchangensis]|uniref:sensor histidine kinase n=1 Tax=Nonomuraea wenchangensis TaxID=568860 RepID=UPI0037A1A50E